MQIHTNDTKSNRYSVLTCLRNWFAALLFRSSDCEKNGTNTSWTLTAPRQPRNTCGINDSSGRIEFPVAEVGLTSDGSRRFSGDKGIGAAPSFSSPKIIRGRLKKKKLNLNLKKLNL